MTFRSSTDEICKTTAEVCRIGSPKECRYKGKIESSKHKRKTCLIIKKTGKGHVERKQRNILPKLFLVEPIDKISRGRTGKRYKYQFLDESWWNSLYKLKIQLVQEEEGDDEIHPVKLQLVFFALTPMRDVIFSIPCYCLSPRPKRSP
jgi:hypothetical protein